MTKQNREPQQNEQQQANTQRGNNPDQHGGRNARPTDESPEMHDGDQPAQSSERLRRGALDAQYGTDSSSKTGEQGTGTQSPTGTDRDTMGGPRSKGH